VIHKRLQADIVCEDRLRTLTDTAVRARGVSGTGVEFAKQETSLGATCVANDEAWEREAILNEVLRDTASDHVCRSALASV